MRREKPESSWVLLVIQVPHGGANIWIGIQDNGGGHGSALEMLSACVLVV